MTALLGYLPRSMQVADPAALAVGLGLLAGLPGASLVRRGRRILGAAGAAAAGAALGSGVFELPGSAGLVAAAAGFASALALPGLGLGRFRRRSFGTAFGPGASAVSLAEARLPARLGALRPSKLVDPAECLRLERVIQAAEEKSGVELGLAISRRCRGPEAASWRVAAFAAVLGLAAAAAFAPSTPRAAPAAALLGALAGRGLAAAPRVRRFATREEALAEAAAEGAFDAFARLGLVRAPGRAGVLVFAALFEGRVVVLGDGAAGQASKPGAGWDEVAAAAAAGLAAGSADGLVRALEGAAAIAARALPPAGARAPGSRPLPVRIED